MDAAASRVQRIKLISKTNLIEFIHIIIIYREPYKSKKDRPRHHQLNNSDFYFFIYKKKKRIKKGENH